MISQRERNQYSIKIIGIDPNGTSVKILSPIDGDKPMPIKKGTRLVIHEQLKGDEARSYFVVAGPDPNNPKQPYQYFDDDIGRWVLIVQQADDRPIGARSAVRVDVVFDVTLTVVESNRKYKASSKNLSATGILLSVGSDFIIPRGSEVVLDFQLPYSSYKLPPITGKVTRLENYDLGIEFDNFKSVNQPFSESAKGKKKRVQTKIDQDEIIRFVLRKQGL